jgi:hypothetical protein
MGAEMALQLASESLGEREERDFQRRLENPPSPATERRLLFTAKRFHTVCLKYTRAERFGSPVVTNLLVRTRRVLTR